MAGQQLVGSQSLKVKTQLLQPAPSPQETKLGAQLQQSGFDTTYLACGPGSFVLLSS